jgi:hypothetical protein
MNGTEKQIKWATYIQNQLKAGIDKFFADMLSQARKSRPEQVSMVEVLQRRANEGFVDTVTAYDDAVWWINYRNVDAREFVRPYHTAYIQELKK